MLCRTNVHSLGPLATMRRNAGKRRVWGSVIEVLNRRNFYEAYRRRQELQQGSTTDASFYQPTVTVLAYSHGSKAVPMTSLNGLCQRNCNMSNPQLNLHITSLDFTAQLPCARF